MFLLKIAFVLIFMLSLKISFICISIDGDNSMKKPIVNSQIRRTWEGGQEYITRGGGLSNNPEHSPPATLTTKTNF